MALGTMWKEGKFVVPFCKAGSTQAGSARPGRPVRRLRVGMAVKTAQRTMMHEILRWDKFPPPPFVYCNVVQWDAVRLMSVTTVFGSCRRRDAALRRDEMGNK